MAVKKIAQKQTKNNSKKGNQLEFIKKFFTDKNKKKVKKTMKKKPIKKIKKAKKVSFIKELITKLKLKKKKTKVVKKVKINKVKKNKIKVKMPSVLIHKRGLINGVLGVVVLMLFIWLVAIFQFNSFKKIVSEYNLDVMMNVGKEYFGDGLLPQEAGETLMLSLGEMLLMDLTAGLKGNITTKCDLNKTNVRVTKLYDNSYSLAADIYCNEDNIIMKDESLV